MPALNRIGQLALTVDDLPAATAFYRDVLELPLLFEAGGMVFFQLEGQRLMLTTPLAPGEHYASILYFASADIDADYSRLSAAGVGFQGEPAIEHRAPGYELWLAFFKDPHGNTHALMEERQEAVA